MIIGDLRHWFHQLSIAFKKYVGVATREGVYLWRTLPMGLSWSPYVAQAIGLLMLTYHESGEESLFILDDLSKSSLLPQYLELRGGGFPVVVL
jgi:hypothetical protein